jgi:hypothetical protein
MVCHWKGPAAALQVRENAIAAFPMQALEPLLEHALEFHTRLLHVFSAIIRPSGRARSPRL